MPDNLFIVLLDAIIQADFQGLIFPLLVYTLLIAAYGIFVWAYYKSVSKRDLFKLEVRDHRKQWRVRIGYVLKYLILFPVLVFLWFAALTIILFFLSKSQSVQNILLLSMAMVAAARITAYYKETLSEEISKILPLAVLGIFVIEPAFFSLSLTVSRFYEVASLTGLLFNYLLFTVILEFILRVLLTVKQRFSRSTRVKAVEVQLRRKKDGRKKS